MDTPSGIYPWRHKILFYIYQSSVQDDYYCLTILCLGTSTSMKVIIVVCTSGYYNV